MNRKKIGILIALSLLLVVVFVTSYSYSLFESSITGQTQATIADWIIKVNNDLISDGQNEYFSINEIHYTKTNSNIRQGKFAPGVNGYYDIEIDSRDTKVAVEYDIYVDDFESENLKVKDIDLMQGSSNFTKINEKEFKGVIPVGSTVNQILRVYLEWKDLNTPEANAADTEMGTKENPDVEIPVTLHFIQYIGG